MLGRVVDLKLGTIRAKEARVEKLKSLLSLLNRSRRPSARELAKLTGYLLSMSIVLGPICRLRTRSFYAMIFERSTWDSRLSWSEEALSDMAFWIESFRELHGQPFWKKEPRAAVLTWSDASETGWGGHVAGAPGNVAKGNWTGATMNAKMSSTWRELRAIALVLESVAEKLAGQICIHRSDNQAAVHIVKHGSRRSHLQEVAMEIHAICMKWSIKLEVEWVPRDENELADYYSKLVDRDD